jgi:Ca2+-binding RTX toxin-like protein
MNVTISGGSGQPPVSLTYDANDAALLNATALAATLSATYPSPIYYNPQNPVSGFNGGELIIQQANASGGTIDARGFDAVIDQNNGVASTVNGGFAANQIVLAGDGGLTFHSFGGNATVVAGGGDNMISFANQGGNEVVYTSIGNDTVIAGLGNATISAGAGINKIVLGAGAAQVISTGQDHINLGSGTTTVSAGAGGSDYIVGAQSVSGSGYNLTFVGGDLASTIKGGAGSYSITGGAGGGWFQGGSAGNNSILGGAGAVTIFGGGAGDTLFGGSGGGRIFAGAGNETLGGGGANTTLFGGTGSDSLLVGSGDETVRAGLGSDTIQFTANEGGYGVRDVLQDFNSSDVIHLAGFDANAVNYALSTFKAAGSNGSFKLEDGTTVLLQGVTHLTASNFN